MTRVPLLLIALLLAPAALAQQGTAPYETPVQDKFDRLNRSLDSLLAGTQRLDHLRRTLDDLQPDLERLDALRRTLDAQLADPRRLDNLRRTLDGLKRTLDAERPAAPSPETRSLDPQTPASPAAPFPPRP